MREPFGANTGISQNAIYSMIAVLIAVAIIGGIYGEKRLAETRDSVNIETSTPAPNN